MRPIDLIEADRAEMVADHCAGRVDDRTFGRSWRYLGLVRAMARCIPYRQVERRVGSNNLPDLNWVCALAIRSRLSSAQIAKWIVGAALHLRSQGHELRPSRWDLSGLDFSEIGRST